MARFEVIESKHWVRDDGRTASIYGAVPWVSPSEEKRWKIVSRGYTIRDNERGTVGIGRQPWATRAEAQAWVDKETARLEEARRWHEANYPKKPAAPAKRGRTKKSGAQMDREIAQALAGASGSHSLYKELLAAGVPTDHHESDLYVLDTRVARGILAAHGKKGTTFKSKLDGKRWIDVPFAYEPFWEKASRASRR